MQMRLLTNPYTQPNITTSMYIKLDLSQFAAQTIENWYANSSTGNTPMVIKNSVPKATLFSIPHLLNFNMLILISNFQLKKCSSATMMKFLISTFLHFRTK